MPIQPYKWFNFMENWRIHSKYINMGIVNMSKLIHGIALTVLKEEEKKTIHIDQRDFNQV